MAEIDFFYESFCKGEVLGTRELTGVLVLFDTFGIRIKLNMFGCFKRYKYKIQIKLI